MVEAGKYGQQYKGDDRFTARLRFHQSWWRHDRLGVAAGSDQRGNTYGNYLTEGAAADGLNFLTPAIAQYARERISSGGGVEEFRCTRNLLSSQPMAFNLFGPLHIDSELAATLLRPLIPGGVAAAEVEIEWAPDSHAHLHDRTSFDAVARCRREDWSATIVAIETKLTEPFSQRHYDTPRYRSVAKASTVWRDPQDLDLADQRWNQLWRNQLLVEAMRQQRDAAPDLRGVAVVVHHPDDIRCHDTVAAYRRFLTSPGTSFLALPLDVIAAAWRPLVSGSSYAPWLKDFEDRYINLFLSAEAWEQHLAEHGGHDAMP